MKKYWWILVVILMLAFEVGNFYLTYIALVGLVGTIGLGLFGYQLPLAILLPSIFTLMDAGMVRLMFLPISENPIDPRFMAWFLSGLINTLLICLAAEVIFHFGSFGFVLIVVLGTVWFAIRTHLFIWGPVTFVMK